MIGDGFQHPGTGQVSAREIGMAKVDAGEVAAHQPAAAQIERTEKTRIAPPGSSYDSSGL